MNKTLANALKYILSLAASLLLLYFAFRDISFSEISKQFATADYKWIALSIVFAILSHIVRAYRWLLLMRPLGHHFSLFHSFLAVMTGYFMNTVIPRAGELARCGILQKMNGTPFTTALGTIVLERMIDMLILLLLLMIVLAGAYGELNQLIYNSIYSKIPAVPLSFYLAALLFGIALLALVYLMRKRIMDSSFFAKFRNISLQVITGVLSIRNVQNKTVFVFLSLLIWLMYYLMAFVLFFAFPDTSHLDIWFGLIVLVMGAFGMAAPVQGGFGAYHLMVGTVFALRGLSVEQGILMATFMHTIQTLTLLIAGGLSFLIALSFVEKKGKEGK